MNIDSEVRSLQEVPMFKDIEPARLKLMAFASDRVAFASGETVFRQGDASDSAYVLLDGKADVRLGAGDTSFSVATLSKSAIVGEMGVLTGAARSATVVAATDVIALRIRQEVFFDMIREFPAMAISVMRDLAMRLERTNARLAESMNRR
jgi:CRP-like cAMP-binding protein